jgi:hypothetical protein
VDALMLSNLKLIWQDRAIRVAVVGLFCVGLTYASTVPYLPIIAVDQLKMTEGQFAWLSALPT